jgi:hypothetical protein
LYRKTRESPSPAFNAATQKRENPLEPARHGRHMEMDESYVLSYRHPSILILTKHTASSGRPEERSFMK